MIGDLNVFEAKSNVGYGCEIKNGCIVKATEVVKPNSKLENHTIVNYDGVSTYE